MKKFGKMLSTAALFFFFALPAFADKCKDQLVDEVSALSSIDIAQIEKSMSMLGQKGADVRVQVLSSFHRDPGGEMNKSLEAYKAQMLGKCRSWQAADGGMKNNLVLVLVAPKQKKTYLGAGAQWDRTLSAERKSQVVDAMNARFRDGKLSDGIVAGLDHMNDLASVKPSQEGRPVTINHAADYSGFSNFLKWALFFAALGGAISFFIWLYRQNEVRRTAQRNAQADRARCTQSLNSHEEPLAVLGAKVKQADINAEWKTHLNHMLDQARNCYRIASTQYGAVNRGANDPDTPRLSVAEYDGMRERYRSIAGKFAEADQALAMVENELRRALRGEPITMAVKQKAVGASAATSKSDRRQQVPPVTTSASLDSSRKNHGRQKTNPPTSSEGGNTKVVHHHDDGPGFATGVVVGHILTDTHDHAHRDRPSDPVIITPDFSSEGGRSGGGGASADWGKSTEGSGVEKDWGASGSGNSAESSWSSAESSRSGTSY